MIFLNTGIFFIGLLHFLLMWQVVFIYKKDWRSAFVSAALYFGLFICILTELLSVFNSLGFVGVLSGWLIYGICLSVFLFVKYKKGEFSVLKIPFSFLRKKESLFLGFLLLVTFFIAVCYPPNNWDSMTYHLPRIEHWLQNGNLDHYYTSNLRQVVSAPFAEIAILHGRVLSGDDWLMNLVQWSAYLGTIIVISRIAASLGLDRRKQIIASLFFATLPMAILQASSTQTDLVEAFWIVCLIDRFFSWKKERTLLLSVDFGIALGLAILTKGTAYAFALPFVAYFAILCCKDYRKYMVGAVLAAVICLAINMPHFTRNYISYKNPLGIHSDKTVSDFSLSSFAISFVSGAYVNVPVPLPFSIEINNALKEVDKSKFPYGSLLVHSYGSWKNDIKNIPPFHEDTARNTLHFIIFLIALFVSLYKKKYRVYASLVALSWCVFAFFIPWQPWVTRLQVPLFAISAPLFAALFDSEKRLRSLNFILLFICCFSLLPLFFNRIRPLLSINQIPVIKNWTVKENIWNTSRERLLFNNKSYLYEDYRDACISLSENNVQDIALVIGGDSWEYPLWYQLRHSMVSLPHIQHLAIDSIQNSSQKVFFINIQRDETITIDSTSIEVKKDIPSVYYRDNANKTK